MENSLAAVSAYRTKIGTKIGKLASSLEYTAITSLFRKVKGPVLGVDIGTSAIKIVELAPSSGGSIKLTRWAIHSLPAGVITENTISNVDAVIDVFVSAVERESINAKRAVVAVSASHAVSSNITLPKHLSDDEMESLVELEASQFVPYPLEDVNLDFQVLGASGLNPEDNEVLAVACRREIIEDCVAVIEAAELEVQIVDIDTYALERVVAHACPSIGLVAVVDIGHASTHLGVFDGDQTLYSRYQAFGGKQLVDLVVQSFGVSDEEAKGLIGSENPPDGYQKDVLPQFVQMAAKEIARALQFFFSSGATSSVDRIIVTGGISQIPGLLKGVANEVGVSTIVLDPFANIQHSFNSHHFVQNSGSLTVACGLALRGIYDRD
ncbi:MAG: type IV pilus assembly protein PilM [Proteobacteria bacterium]|jgi:type IV pilus assembly protein PilM|nr:type IV pilus assembly protein PilM [Pseudomonadota bacterium]